MAVIGLRFSSPWRYGFVVGVLSGMLLWRVSSGLKSPGTGAPGRAGTPTSLSFLLNHHGCGPLDVVSFSYLHALSLLPSYRVVSVHHTVRISYATLAP